MQERRRAIRIDAPVLVEFPNPDTMKTERSYTSDVSERGMRFPTAVRLQVSQKLPLAIQLPFGGASMHATGDIMWIREIARQGDPQYEVGVQFEWVEDPDRQHLTRFLLEMSRRRV